MKNKIINGVIAFILLISGSAFSQNSINESVDYFKLDSLVKGIVINALIINGQSKTQKLFVDTTKSNYNLELMQSFFSVRTNKDVKNVNDYKKLLSDLENFQNEKFLNLDIIKKNFLSTNFTFNQVSEGEIKEFLDTLSDEREKSQTINDVAPEARKNSSVIEQTIAKPKVNPFLWSLIWFAGGSLFIGLIWILMPKSKNKMSKNKDKSINRTPSYADLEKKTSTLEMRIVSLEKQLKICQTRQDNSNKISEGSDGSLKEKIWVLAKSAIEGSDATEVKNVPNKEVYKYFSTPLSDSSFKDSEGRDTFLEGASIYRFTVISASDAEFEICNESSSVSMAMNNRNELILSVAEEKEGDASNSKGILTYNGNKGKVKLENNRWIVERKLQIKYI